MELTFLYSKAIITSTPTQVLDPKFCTAAYILIFCTLALELSCACTCIMYQHIGFILKANNISLSYRSSSKCWKFHCPLVNTETPATQRKWLFQWDNKSIIFHLIGFSCSIKRKHMTSRLEFLFSVAQIALLMQFSEVPILTNDFFSGWWGRGGTAFIIDCNISVSNNAPSFGQVWIKTITMMMILTVVHPQSGWTLFSIVPNWVEIWKLWFCTWDGDENQRILIKPFGTHGTKTNEKLNSHITLGTISIQRWQGRDGRKSKDYSFSLHWNCACSNPNSEKEKNFSVICTCHS